MGGIFNITDPVFMQPLYIWAFVIVIILIGLSWAEWYYRGWKPYEPLHGLYYAMKNFSTVAFIFDGNLVGEMVVSGMQSAYLITQMTSTRLKYRTSRLFDQFSFGRIPRYFIIRQNT